MVPLDGRFLSAISGVNGCVFAWQLQARPALRTPDLLHAVVQLASQAASLLVDPGRL